MPAKSKAQQKLFALALAYKRGEVTDVSDEVKELSKLPEKDLLDYAETKHDGLPNKVESFKEMYFAEYEGKLVPLDSPMIEYSINEEKEPELNKPKRNSGDGKKYVVYVKDPKTGNVKKITFGDKKGGLTSKINDPEARKAFASRHNCEAKTDKLSPGYWACRLPKYAKSLGLKGGGDYFW